jgi:DNA topoisomerase-2
MDAAVQITEVKENKVAKKTDGTKSKRITGIPKLTDANFAGKEQSHLCSLILCEGDSAKSGIISGLSSDDRNTIGVYPLKGKVMNIRGETIKKINENKEIAELKKIIGLESGRKYNDINDVHKYLRYSKIIFMTDQDLDGSHIKGLCINLFQCEWPTLCEIPGFICFMNTPILKAKKGKQELNFYNDGEYNLWKQSNNDGKGWNIKYYKGLGTSTGKEFKEYFQEKKYIGFSHSEQSNNAIDMVFNKKRADDRKDWLNQYNRDSYLDTNNQLINYEEFINKELIHFSKYDCDRSIPNLMDGLKISLRKILFSAFKKNLTSEIKVAQFSGYVSEQSCYHHGEASLNKAIVGMAQNFVGSNNINMLVPSGQFGTRIQGGNDSASERYIFTYLNPITRLIFKKEDDMVLKYLNDDGHPVEPLFYVPIIPMVLVNGSKGIGTGFSTDIMCYNPQEIIQYIKNKLENKLNKYEFIPYYEGFKGQVIALNTTKYMFKGCYTKIGPDKIRVTELPVGYWTEDFKVYLEELLEPVDKEGKKLPAIIKDYDDMSKDTNVDFIITFSKGKLDELESILDTNLVSNNNINGVEKLLKLTTTNTTTNMNLFDAEEKLKKYENVSDIIDDYFDTRLVYYDERKDALIDELEKELIELSNKAKYIKENIVGTIDLRKKKKEQIIQMLEDKGYDIINNDNEYKYLVKMPMDSVSEENVAKLLKDHGDKEAELVRIKNTTIQQMWLNDLELLEKAYQEYIKERNNEVLENETKKQVVKKSVKKVVAKKGPVFIEDE